jgi:hypothetical protein
MFASLALALCLAVSPAPGESSRQLLKKARKAEQNQNFTDAFLNYAKAAAQNPASKELWQRAQAVRGRALVEMGSRQPIPPETLCNEAPEEEVGDSVITDAELAEARELRPPPRLQGDAAPKSHELRGPAKQLFEQVARAYGLQAAFDPDYPPAGEPLRFRMESAAFQDALHALEVMTGSFLRPLDATRLFVAKDTQQKRVEFEPTVALVLPIPETVSVQEAQELGRMVQQAMEIQKFAVDGNRRLVLLRDRISKAYPARDVFDQVLLHRPMVSIEIELLSVARNFTQNLGIRLPTSLEIFSLVTQAPFVTTLPAGIPLITFFGGQSKLGFTLSSADLFAAMTEGSGRSLHKVEIRTVAMQPAQLLIGDRYPIITAGYYGEVPSNPDIPVYTPPPTVTFENLGLTVKATPFVHGEEELTIEFEIEMKLLSGAGVNGIPIISNRKLASRVRMKNSEWIVMGGLLSEAEAKSISGIAGLSSLPVIGPLLRQNNKSSEEANVLMVIRPRLLSIPPTEELTKEFWVGTEGRPYNPL